MARRIKRIYRDLTSEEQARLVKLREKLDAERPEIEAQGRALLAAQRTARALIAQLKAERERQGLSLADIKARCGIAREVISTLESNQSPNPTVKTLQRYAMALGLQLELSVH
jgi:hypothetical protein